MCGVYFKLTYHQLYGESVMSRNQRSAFEQFQKTRKDTNDVLGLFGQLIQIIVYLPILAIDVAAYSVMPIIHYPVGHRGMVPYALGAILLFGIPSDMYQNGISGELIQFWGAALVVAYFAQIIAAALRLFIKPKEHVYRYCIGSLTPPLRWLLEKLFRGLVWKPYFSLIVLEPFLMAIFAGLVWLAEQYDIDRGIETPGGAYWVPLIAASGVFLFGLRMLAKEAEEGQEMADQYFLQERKAEVAEKRASRTRRRDPEGFVEHDA